MGSRPRPATEPPARDAAPLPPPTRPLLVYALSGLGKSTLCARFEAAVDTDVALDAALAGCFPALDDVRARRIAWRALARSAPWSTLGHPDLARWAETRRAFVEAILTPLRADRPRLVLTNLLHLPWPYARYYGVELGRYRAHWDGLTRVADNGQDEAQNTRLEGYAPLVRLPPGRFLSDDPELCRWLKEAE